MFVLRTISIVIIVMLISFFGFRYQAFCADEVSSNDLIENAKAMDGKDIIYIGEAVTAILDRGNNSCVNVKDNYNAIGVWCGSSDLKPVKFLGGYKVRGDTLEIHGVFHRACPIHGGELDIHAESVNIVKQGFEEKEKIDTKSINISIILFSIVIIMAVAFRKRF